MIYFIYEVLLETELKVRSRLISQCLLRLYFALAYERTLVFNVSVSKYWEILLDAFTMLQFSREM